MPSWPDRESRGSSLRVQTRETSRIPFAEVRRHSAAGDGRAAPDCPARELEVSRAVARLWAWADVRAVPPGRVPVGGHSAVVRALRVGQRFDRSVVIFIGIGVGFLKWKRLGIHLSNQFFHLLARLEGHHVLGGDIHLVAGAGVAGLARGTLLDLEDAEIPQLDPALGNQRLDDRIEGPLDDVLRLELGQIDILGNLLDDLFLGHVVDLRGGGVGPACRTESERVGGLGTVWAANGSSVLVAWIRVKKKTPRRRRDGELTLVLLRISGTATGRPWSETGRPRAGSADGRAAGHSSTGEHAAGPGFSGGR